MKTKTMNEPATPFAVSGGEVAMPSELVVALALGEPPGPPVGLFGPPRPGKLAPARASPEMAKKTVTLLSGLPAASVNFTPIGLAYFVLIRACWPSPLMDTVGAAETKIENDSERFVPSPWTLTPIK